jgi:imidazolonepropionase-like amidohydrolase
VSEEEARGWQAVDARQRARDASLLDRVFNTFGRIVADLHAGGTTILAGTDLGNPHVFAGSSLHDELVLLVEAGLSPRDALAAATLNPARVLGLQASLGSIEAGKLADLVLLDANPLESIRNVSRISGVISNGRYFSPAELRALQEEVARAVRAPTSPR